ncbi:MAG: diphosphomevalonate decarboxylase [Candidatus Thermoplasmatota archaeon]|nr:diphosphomevalonate decarboxylase [Candidatus Thermoplasmatota archaeon]MCL5731504.1 diphosphomevalonate decarboxylase [Candidatus Thermoplasmatota archaeon]
MPGTFCETRAYPTIGIILLGGISNNTRRFPLHDSAGVAYMLDDGSGGFVTTRMFSSHIWQGFVNGKEVNAMDTRSPFKVIKKYRDSMLASVKDPADTAFSFYSENTGILSGSSDAAAASFGRCIEEFSRGELDESVLEDDLRGISESVGRSLKGGLTATFAVNGRIITENLAPASAFSDFRIVGCNFSANRNPSDIIHSNIVRSERYADRIRTAGERVASVRMLAQEHRYSDIFELAQKDTEDYHNLIESVGVRVINHEMRSFIDYLKTIRDRTWCSYIVTGGTNVFAVVNHEDTDKITELSERFGFTPYILKIAGAPVTLQKNF